MSGSEYESMFRTTIICVIFTGLLAVLSSGLVIADYGDHIGQLSSASRAITSLIKKTVLILSESLFSMAFSCTGILMLFFVKDFSLLKNLSVTALGLKVVFALFLYIYYFKTWYYILDPNGSHTGVYFVIIFSALQLLTLITLFFSFKQLDD